MAKYRKTVGVEISDPWYPQVPGLLSELGVRPRGLKVDSERARRCPECDCMLMDHGEVNTLEGVHIVCPGDRIVTGVQNEHYPIKPDIFDQTYRPADSPALNDTAFIDHIANHLRQGRKDGCDAPMIYKHEVVCKICGKTAKEICGVTSTQ